MTRLVTILRSGAFWFHATVFTVAQASYQLVTHNRADQDHFRLTLFLGIILPFSAVYGVVMCLWEQRRSHRGLPAQRAP